VLLLATVMLVYDKTVPSHPCHLLLLLLLSANPS
jgi:hypothetical protein